MKLVVASDEKNEFTDSVISYLEQKSHNLLLLGNLIDENKKWKWVEVGLETAQRLTNNEAEIAVLMCGSGTGVCMAANRLKGARAALCWSKEIAQQARKWDNANILCLSYEFIDKEKLPEIIDAFLETEFDEEDLNEVSKLDR